MLKQNLYKQNCKNIGVSPLPSYTDYQEYEKLWRDYVNEIVFKYIPKHTCCVRLVLCESCPHPKGTGHPYEDYIFNILSLELTSKNSYYLYQI